MDGKSQKGSYPKRLVASSYLLELVPDVQQTVESIRSRVHLEGLSSQYQLSSRPEESGLGSRQDLAPVTQSLHWGGRDSIRDKEDPTQRFSPAVMTKSRLSRSKKRPAPEFTHDVAMPIKDNVIFDESPVAPGVPVVYRLPEERTANPDRLNLDRRHLTVCPILEGEDKLRLLNLQHNAITRLQNLSNLRRLVFLDLYDNLIHEISGLEGLLSLRVLMLGKNRIRKISGLQTLMKLDVLDLHGNMIRYIECLNHLTHLRVLNLAGNDITCVSSLAGLQVLAELNLRRNRITHVYEIDELLNLQRLFLSHNLIQSFDDVSCLSGCDSLSELTLDGNPLANAPDHRPSAIFHVSHLRVLDQTPVTEEERDDALAAAREEEERLKEGKKLAQRQEHKEAAVSAIRRAWQSSHKLPMSSSLALSASTHNFAGRVDLLKQSRASLHRSSSLPQLLPTYFVDLDSSCLYLYGEGALESLQDTGGHTHSQTVDEIQFHYIEFEELAPFLAKVSRNYPLVRSLTLECTNLCSLEQLNALSLLTTPLHTLTVTTHGNPITGHPLFRSYLLYQLTHLGLTCVCGEGVGDAELVLAEQLFGNLGQLTTSQLSQDRLLGLISKHRPTPSKKVPLTSRTAKRGTVLPVCQEPLNRVALHNHSHLPHLADTAHQERRLAAQNFCSSLLSSTLQAHQKLENFERLWPSVMRGLVQRVLREFGNIDQEMRTLLEQL